MYSWGIVNIMPSAIKMVWPKNLCFPTYNLNCHWRYLICQHIVINATVFSRAYFSNPTMTCQAHLHLMLIIPIKFQWNLSKEEVVDLTNWNTIMHISTGYEPNHMIHKSETSILWVNNVQHVSFHLVTDCWNYI